jgi:DNA-binding CsgD family transcriptional regulator
MTPKEFATLYAALGMTRKELYAALWISPRTGRNYASGATKIHPRVVEQARKMLEDHRQ